LLRLRHWSPNTVRGYATSLGQWWAFLEARGESGSWDLVGVPAVAGFLGWLREGRVDARFGCVVSACSEATVETRLGAVVSFYRWHGAVHDVGVAARLLRGAPLRASGRGLLSHLDRGKSPGASSLVRVRRSGRRERPPLLLLRQVQAILDGCAVYDGETGG
jgi:hypothetical protein